MLPNETIIEENEQQFANEIEEIKEENVQVIKTIIEENEQQFANEIEEIKEENVQVVNQVEAGEG